MAKPKNVFEKKAESVTYSWTFEEFPKNSLIRIKRMFTTELCGHATTWSLNIVYDPMGDSVDPFSIELLHHGRSIFNIIPLITATLLKNDGPPIVHEKEATCDRVEGDWEYYGFDIDSDELDWDEILDYRLKLEVCISCNLLKKSATNKLWAEVVLPSGTNADIDELLKINKKRSDFEIATETENFHVSRYRLTQRSIGFYKMYAYEECKDDEVLRIEDVGADFVREMLRYLYTGTVNNIDENAEDLLVLVDRYDIPRLKVMCDESLGEQLNEENLSKMTDLAERYQLKVLKKNVANFNR